jgi:hypothetical protein
MRPERIVELQKLVAQSYPEYYTLYKGILGGNIFFYKESPSEEAIIILKAVDKFEHRIAL